MIALIFLVCSISIERHQAEIRRVANDEKLTTIAHFLSGSEETSSEWQAEGKRLIPLLPRLVPQTAFFELAGTVATAQYKQNERMPPPGSTGRKRGANQPPPTPGKKMKEESITIRRKAIPSSPTPISLPPTVPSTNNRRQPQPVKSQPLPNKRPPVHIAKPVAGKRAAVSRVAVPVPVVTENSSTAGRVIFVQSVNQQQAQQQQQLTSHMRISNASGISNNNSSLSTQSVQQLKQFKSGQPVILVSANSLHRLASCPPSHSSPPPPSLSSSSSLSNVSNSLSMTRSNQTSAGQVIYQTAKNPNTGRANLILLPSKGNGISSSSGGGNVFSSSSSNNHHNNSSNGVVINHNNHHISLSACSNSNSNSSSLRSQVVTLPSDASKRSQTAPLSILRDKRQAVDRGRSEVNGSGASVRMEETVTLTATSPASSSNHHSVTGSNPQRGANVIEIQASGEVLESLKRKGQLSQDIIALVQKAVSMANGATGNHRPPSESHSIIPRLPKLPVQPVISVLPECEEQKRNLESVIDP